MVHIHLNLDKDYDYWNGIFEEVDLYFVMDYFERLTDLCPLQMELEERVTFLKVVACQIPEVLRIIHLNPPWIKNNLIKSYNTYEWKHLL